VVSLKKDSSLPSLWRKDVIGSSSPIGRCVEGGEEGGEERRDSGQASSVFSGNKISLSAVQMVAPEGKKGDRCWKKQART